MGETGLKSQWQGGVLMTNQDVFSARRTLETNSGPVTFYNVNALEEQGIGQISRMPFSIKVMLESLLRNVNGYDVLRRGCPRACGVAAGTGRDYGAAQVGARDLAGLYGCTGCR